jgi:rhodanese-related sulfurtransferase
MRTITREELKKKIDNKEDFTLIEVLKEDTYNEWHIPTAIHILITNIKDKAPSLLTDKNKEIIVYCASFECHASDKAVVALEELGYTNVKDFSGGKKDWEEAGFPKEQ